MEHLVEGLLRAEAGCSTSVVHDLSLRLAGEPGALQSLLSAGQVGPNQLGGPRQLAALRACLALLEHRSSGDNEDDGTAAGGDPATVAAAAAAGGGVSVRLVMQLAEAACSPGPLPDGAATLEDLHGAAPGCADEDSSASGGGQQELSPEQAAHLQGAALCLRLLRQLLRLVPELRLGLREAAATPQQQQQRQQAQRAQRDCFGPIVEVVSDEDNEDRELVEEAAMDAKEGPEAGEGSSSKNSSGGSGTKPIRLLPARLLLLAAAYAPLGNPGDISSAAAPAADTAPCGAGSSGGGGGSMGTDAAAAAAAAAASSEAWGLALDLAARLQASQGGPSLDHHHHQQQQHHAGPACIPAAAAAAVAPGGEGSEAAGVPPADISCAGASGTGPWLRQLLVGQAGNASALLLPVVCAYSDHDRAQQLRFEVYRGPDTAARVLAARQARWWGDALCSPYCGGEGVALGAALPPLLPLALAALRDPSPLVQEQGIWALYRVSCCCSAAELAPWQTELRSLPSKLATGCDRRLWRAASLTSCSLALLLEGSSPRGLAPLVEALVCEGERWAHQADSARCWLEAAPAVLRSMGLALVPHLPRVMPLLLRWLHLPDARCAEVALGALGDVVRATWPRADAHARIIRHHLAQLYLMESREGGAAAAGATATAGAGGSEGVAGEEAAAAAVARPSSSIPSWDWPPGPLAPCPGDSKLLLCVKDTALVLDAACRRCQQEQQQQQEPYPFSTAPGTDATRSAHMQPRATAMVD